MTRSDIGVIAIIYATCLLFLYMTLKLVPEAQIYPLCLIAALALLNTCYLGKCVLRFALERRKNPATHIANDLPEIFSGFLPRQFSFIVGACVAYMVLLHYVGFYVAGLIYMIAVLLWLKVRPLVMGITICILFAMIYGVFSVLLKVPLPTGTFFS